MISFSENITQILKEVVIQNPSRILDVGFGFGKYGLLCREAIMSDRAEKKDLTPADDIYIMGLEMADYFFTLKWATAPYNEVKKIEKDETITTSQKFDLALMIDVTEHHVEEESKRQIKNILEVSDKVLISTPKNTCMYREHYYGVDCPRHEMQWTQEMFESFAKELGRDIKWIPSDVSWVCVIG